MGTDVHMWAEIRNRASSRIEADKRQAFESRWHTVGSLFDNPWYKLDRIPILYSGDGCYEPFAPKTFHPYTDRNYDMFAMLADVRNGRGFAGVDTGDGFVPIAEPRGFPLDMSDFMQEESKKVEHTPSWLSLDELNAYNWEQTTKHRGWVNPPEYKEFLAEGKPSYCAGSVSGAGIEHVSTEEMDKFLAANPDLSLEHDPFRWKIYTLVEWEEYYRESAGRFYTETLPKLREIRALESVLDLRIVFWFDS